MMQRPILGSNTRPASVVAIVSMCRHHPHTARDIARDLHKPWRFCEQAVREALSAGLLRYLDGRGYTATEVEK